MTAILHLFLYQFHQLVASGGMVLVAYAGPVRPAAALRDSVLGLPTDIHSLLVNKTLLPPPPTFDLNNLSSSFSIVSERRAYRPSITC